MALPMLKSAFTDLHDARFRQIYDDKYNGYEPVYEKIFQSTTSDRSYEQYSSVSGHTLMTEKSESDTVATEARVQGLNFVGLVKSFLINGENLSLI